jgi:hypothetical protein
MSTTFFTRGMYFDRNSPMAHAAQPSRPLVAIGNPFASSRSQNDCRACSQKPISLFCIYNGLSETFAGA